MENSTEETVALLDQFIEVAKRGKILRLEVSLEVEMEDDNQASPLEQPNNNDH